MSKSEFEELVVDEKKLKKDVDEYFSTACVGWEILCCYVDVVKEYAIVNNDEELEKFARGFKLSLGRFKDLRKMLRDRGFKAKCTWERD